MNDIEKKQEALCYVNFELSGDIKSNIQCTISELHRLLNTLNNYVVNEQYCCFLKPENCNVLLNMNHIIKVSWTKLT